MQAEGAADDQRQAGSALHGPLFQLGGQVLAGQELSLHAQGDDLGPLGQLLEEKGGLLFQGGVDLGLGGVLRQPGLRQLGDGELAENPQALFILCAGGGKVLFLQLAHAEEMDADHTINLSLFKI